MKKRNKHFRRQRGISWKKLEELRDISNISTITDTVQLAWVPKEKNTQT